MKHPEQLEGELYMGTEPGYRIQQSGWKARRGEPQGGAGRRQLYPWFIQASEVEAAIAALEADPKPWAGEAIAIYRKMLAERS